MSHVHSCSFRFEDGLLSIVFSNICTIIIMYKVFIPTRNAVDQTSIAVRRMTQMRNSREHSLMYFIYVAVIEKHRLRCTELTLLL